MLGHVVAAKQRSSGRRKRASLVACNNTHNLNASIMSEKVVPRKRRNGKKDENAEPAAPTNHRITDFFPVRRSGRKTAKQIEEEETEALKKAIYTGSNEDDLIVYQDPLKGRGIKAGRAFAKNDFVIEYKGNMMDMAAAKKLEAQYSHDTSIGSYMYFFKYKNRGWCVDATEESPYKGRLINHSALRPNLKTKVVEFHGKHHLILIARRDVVEGEELLYDYGDRTAETIAHSPWLVNT